jgi:hypothetical protein
MDFLGDVGGMYSSLFFLGYISVTFFSHRLFISAILRQLYQVKHVPKSKREKNDNDLPRAAVVPYESFETLNRMESLKKHNIGENNPPPIQTS